jgi:hypothetical protein
MRRARGRLTYANVMATLAMFIAVGGASAFAATQLGKNSVGAKQIRTGAVRSAEVKDRSLLAKDFKSGQLLSGGNGETGAKGTPGLAGEPGKTGPQGPGAISLNGQFPVDNQYHEIATVDGVRVAILCDASSGPATILEVARASSSSDFYGWGIYWVGSSVFRTEGSGAEPILILGGASADLSATAEAHAAGEEEVKYVHVDLNGITASRCNYHGLIIPSS